MQPPCLPNEIWKPLPLIDIYSKLEPNKYFISSLGRVYSTETNRVLSTYIKHGFEYVNLNNKLTKKTTGSSVGKMVLLTFDYREDYKSLSVFYINGNITDNKLCNLAWSDYKIGGLPLLVLPINHTVDEIPTEDGEIWSPVFPVGAFYNFYTYDIFISTHGRAFNFNYQNKRNNPSFIEQYSSHGYPHIGMYKYDDNYNLISVGVSIHRLVANTFLFNPDWADLVINHIDGNPQNNHIENLEWCTQKYNIAHAFNTGLNNFQSDNNSWHQYNIEDVYKIYDLYLEGYSNAEISRKMNNLYNIAIKPRYISSICSGHERIFDLANYLISKGYTCSKLFTKEQLKQLTDLAVLYNSLSAYLNSIQWIKKNTPEFLAAKIIYRTIDSQIIYNNYILT